MGVGLFASVSAILAWLASRLLNTGPVQSAGALGQWLPMPATSAATQEPMSPTSGAAMATLLSISVGEISICMNCLPVGAPQVLPLPCESSQFRRAPISSTTSDSASTYERAAEAHCAWVSGSKPLAMDMGK